MPDYSNSKIYKLVSKNTDDVYYGSTTLKLNQRLQSHLSEYKRFTNGINCYMSSFDIIKHNNVDIVLLELYPCNKKRELELRERYYIDNNNCVNKNRPVITLKEKIEYKKKIRSSDKGKMMNRLYQRKYYHSNGGKVKQLEYKRKKRIWQNISKEFNNILI